MQDKTQKINRRKGFSALLIVIVVGFISLTVSLWLSTSSFWFLKGSIDSKSSEEAKALANACAEVALKMMMQNPYYNGSDSITISGRSCVYTVSSGGGNGRIITVNATAGSIVRKISIITDTFNPIRVVSWQEI